MRQKYMISQEGPKNNLKIREYAILDRALKNVAYSMVRKDSFSLLCEETYDGAAITQSISRGMDDLVATIRTVNLFPIEPHANKIAESVIALYDSAEEKSVELFFDDVDLFVKEPEEDAPAS